MTGHDEETAGTHSVASQEVHTPRRLAVKCYTNTEEEAEKIKNILATYELHQEPMVTEERGKGWRVFAICDAEAELFLDIGLGHLKGLEVVKLDQSDD